jgi:N-acetylglucosamine-6-sulfatase
LVAAAVAIAVAALPTTSTAGPENRPNFLVILVDDQASNTFTPRFMPETYRWIVDPGTKFADGLAAPPLCCPDRAGILTGDYPHNNGVFSNTPGYPSLTDSGDTLPVWLHRGGYRTGFVGKFLNNSIGALNGAKAPGFDRWFATDNASYYYNYGIADQGTRRTFGNDSGSYTTNVFTRQAKEFLDPEIHGTKPWFLWLAYNAPHDAHQGRGHCKRLDPLVDRPADYRRFATTKLPRPPSFNEEDTSDKPPAVASLPTLSLNEYDNMTRRYRCTAAAMWEVDQKIGAIMSSLKRTGALRNTIVFYLSDNGYFFGEHRITRGKALPYEPALRVPYAVRVPQLYRDSAQRPVVGKVVSNIDVAPTILDYAGALPPCASRSDCRVLDGRSMRPLLGGAGEWPADRGVMAEIDSNAATYAAIRTHGYMYAEYPDGFRELYDLKNDSSELNNLANDPAFASTQLSLAQRLEALRHCSGTAGPLACE